ncbi:MAG TPA: glycoside hydrolase family 15 protein [Alphaproteobacteria bacterium]|nr:glycoside hydrolase family 15 protein [Alphaproteobacteria bacterium]
MALPIEDYGFIGNMRTAGLVGRDGSIDWLCLPRFDSGACFAALLGDRENGRWLIAPRQPVRRTTRRYRGETTILETTFETESGAVTIIDFLAVTGSETCEDLVRLVRGDRGTVEMRTELIIRFDYGYAIPWIRRQDYGLRAIAGPDAVQLRTPVDLRGHDFITEGTFTVRAGETVPFTLSWYPSHLDGPDACDHARALENTESWWHAWSKRCTVGGAWRDTIMRSLITLKALTYQPTGGIVAAPTTSLPEQIGGPRNWDYRFCWIRDATFTLYALLSSGYVEEAKAWREWLLRSAAGRPTDLQIMYGVAGERRLTELELPWLKGYADSRPVRIGNAAHGQLQLDVYGELMDTLHVARKFEVERSDEAWRLQKTLIDYLETDWHKEDEGIWEVRGPRRDFTHSKVMAWVAFDRAVKAVEMFGLDGPVVKWRRLRDLVHTDVCRNGFDPQRNTFVQYYGGDTLDAALLMMAPVGFLPCRDPRIVGTVEAIKRELMRDGLVARYQTRHGIDGLPPGEGAFVACSFWLADNLVMMDRFDEAHALFEHLLSLRNDLGLLAEEYDPVARRQLGNFPQAFSHVALVNTAHNLMRVRGPAKSRADEPRAAAA